MTTLPGESPQNPDRASVLFWVGTYTSDSGAEGRGIECLLGDGTGGGASSARDAGVPDASAPDGVGPAVPDASAPGGAGSAEPGAGVPGGVGPAGSDAGVPGGVGSAEPGAGVPRSDGAGVTGLDAGGLVVEADSPSFLATHPALPVLYAVNEFAQTVTAYARDGASGLTPLGDRWPTGESGCHVAVDPDGRFLIVTCWGDGRVLLFDLDVQGRIVARTEAAPARDPHAVPGARPSRAHSSLMLGDDRVLTTDLGFDLVRVWRYRDGAGLVEEDAIVLPEGSGPRHFALHPSGRVYVDTEYSIEVVVLEEDAGRFAVAGRSAATSAPARDGDAAAEICLSDDGRFAYVGVRGTNRIGTLRIEDDGSARAIADTECGGDRPRHQAVWEGRLLVANQRSGGISVLPIDPATGVPGVAVAELRVPAPVAIIRA